MCGISGYISDKKLNGALIAKTLNHRGPDDFGEYEDFIENKNIYLAHNRLSIIDLSEAGHQPMITEDKQCIIIYNGEIYNFEYLRNKYLKNVTFKSKSDTEVVLYLYYNLGIEFVKELNGDFAIAILDKRINKFFLIRDHVGVKPLYFANKDGCFIFGSEIKAILASGINFELNEDELLNYFVFKYTPMQETMFKHIHRLEQAHYLEFDITSNHFNVIKYWELSKKSEYSSLSFSEAQKEFYNLMQDATNIRLMSDVPVGTFFSGGIDSSIIAYYLKNNKFITHYTAKKSETDIKKEGTTSDFSYAESLATKWNLNLIPIDIGKDEANYNLIKTTLYFSDDLIADGSQIPSYLITKAAKPTSTVMLSGMGADEIFLGYKNHQLHLLTKYFDKFPKFISNPLANFFSTLNQGKGRFKSYRRHLHHFGKYYGLPGKEKNGMFEIVGDYSNSASVLTKETDSSLNIFKKYFDNQNDVFDNSVRFELDNFLVKNLHYVDRMCMANGIEGRVPFLDRRIIEFAYSLPRKYKLNNHFEAKYILKKAYKNYLPHDLLFRRKAGFGMPLRSIFSSEENVYQLLSKDFFDSFDYFSLNDIQRMVKNHVSGKEDNSAIIYALISYQVWYQQWINK